MTPERISEIFNKLENDSILSIPKYIRLCEVLLKMVETNELVSGDKLPTESELTAALPVSLGTVQKALSKLTSRGILVRRQGSGTYVAKMDSELSDHWHFRFMNADRTRVLPVYTTVLSVDRMRDPGPWVSFLGKDDYFVRITREVNVNNEFCGIAQFFLRGSEFGALMECNHKEFEGVHLRNIIQEKFGVSTDRVIERVAAETFPDAVCHWMDRPSFSIGLTCHILGYSHKNKPLSYQQLFVPPNVSPLEIREQQPNT